MSELKVDTITPNTVAVIDAPWQVLQVQYTSLNGTVTSTSTSYVASGLTITITPASISSKFLLSLSGGEAGNTTLAQECLTTFYVGGSEVAETGPYETIRVNCASTAANSSLHSAQMVHSPATASDTTYAVFYKASANTAYFNTASARVVFTVTEFAS